MLNFVVTECLLLIIIGTASSRSPNTTLDSLKCITPLQYFVELNVTSNRFSVKSDCIVNITCATPFHKISVYKKQCDPQIDSINMAVTKFPPSSMTFSRLPLKEQLYRIDIKKMESRYNKCCSPTPITPGVYNIAAKGVCTLNYEGCFSIFPYIDRNNHTRQVFVSHDRDSGVAWVVPLWYNQRVKTNFSLLIRHDKTYTAVSHFPLGSRSPETNKTTNITTTFDWVSAIPINFISVALVPNEFTKIYVEERAHFRRTSLRCRPEIKKYVEHAQSISQKVILNFERKNIFTKYGQVQYIAIPNYEERLTVTPGLVFLRESEIIYDEQGMTNSQKIGVELLAASSVIHHIFVDRFNIDQRDYSWFHEALLKYFAFTELYQIHLNLSDTCSLNAYVAQSQWELLYVEALNNYPLSNEINNNSFSSLRNIEAFRTLRMLDLSTRNFPAPILTPSIHTANRKTSANIWDVINDTMDYLSADFPMTKENRIDKWITQDYVILHVHHTSTRDIKVIVNCTSWTVDKQCNKRFIPITYSIVSNLTSTYIEYETYTTWMTTNVLLVDVPPDNYFIVNPKYFGYYRVNYDLEEWRKIARYLNSTTDFKDPVNYAQILDDAFYFLIQNASSLRTIQIFFELASHLSAQTDYTAWYPMMNALEYLSRYFPFDTSIYIKNKILTILNGFLTTTLYEEDTLLFKKNDTLSYHLRYEVLKWACILEDVKCKEYIKDLIIQDINNPRENKIMVGWRDRFYCQDFLMENVSYDTFQLWHTLYTKWSTTKLLEYLTCSTNYENIYDSLVTKILSSTLLTNHKPSDFKLLQDENIIDKFFLLLAKRSYIRDVPELILHHIKHHVKTSAYRIEKKLAILTVTINNIYSSESYKTVERFIEDIDTNASALRTKYEKTLIVNATRKKLRDHFKFPWAAKWMAMHG